VVVTVLTGGEPEPERESPSGELIWLDHCYVIVGRFMDEVRATFGERWPRLPDELLNAEGWVAWHCVDQEGKRWSRMGDATRMRAAFPDVPFSMPEHTMRLEMNWWSAALGIPYEAFPALVLGWVGLPDDWTEPT
jgi:hypothetical protein